MEKVTEQIKSKLDIAAVLKKYIELVPAGKNLKARCPFHEEKTPSFMVSPERQTWRCFGCNRGGDIFSFVQEYERVEFFEALKILAEQAGVDIKRMSPEQQRQFGVLYDINGAAKDFYTKRLRKTPRVIEYLKERGVKGETAAVFELGAAGGEWDELYLHLTRQGFEVPDMERAGLILRSEKRGTYFDRFRNRVMFPIMNHNGKTVAFTGRVLPEFEATEQAGKYINSPESPIFSKSRILYGYDKSKGFIRETGAALLVEGQMDMIMAWQAGVKNVAAVSGTALTGEHLAVLRRTAKKVMFNFDADEAGWRAGERAVGMAAGADFEVAIVTLPDAKDVAELTAARPEALPAAIAEAVPAMEFFMRRYLLPGADIERKKHGVRAVLAKIKGLASAVEREHWTYELSRRAGVSTAALAEEMAMVETTAAVRIEMAAGVGTKREEVTGGRVELLAERLIAAALEEGDIKKAEPWKEYLPVLYAQAAGAMIDKAAPETVLPQVREIMATVDLRSGVMGGEKLADLGRELQIEFWKGKRSLLAEEVRRLEGAGGEVMPVMEKFKEASLQLERLFEEKK